MAEAAAQVFEGGVGVHPPADEGVVAGEHLGDVAQGLPLLAAHLLLAEGDGVAAQLGDRDLAGVPGAQGGLLEVEADRSPRQQRRADGVGGQRQHGGHLGRAQVVDLEQVAHRREPAHASALSISSMPRSTSSSEMSSDGASRRAVGVTALTMTPARAAGPPRPWRRGPRAPGRAGGRGPARRPRRGAVRGPRRSGRRRASARAGTSSASMTCEHGPGRRGGQRLAAEGGGVVARLEGGGHLRLGPAGPDGHAVAEGLGHGDDVRARCPGCWWANHAPHRPRPVCTSSRTMNRMPRSSQSCRTPWKYSAVAGFTPPSPCTGSSSTAATEGSRAASRASRSSQATWRKPSGRGWNTSCLAGWPVAWRVARVRPWNEP